MANCPSCSRAVGDAASFCPSCGANLSPDSVVATQLLAAGRKPTPPAARAPSSFDTLDRGRFVAGTMLADRYRVIALVGRGGMGEVYKAEDLKLEQTVALKFLPESLSADGAALARLYREVRVARQISHRNVCRVYDIGESAGQHFLSMEFVPGEELASLLRRIGRLPHDKAVEVARQLCAGLAAAHDNGVLHRDLKPANVMIDDAGNVRVTDFGLAGLAEEFQGRDIGAGTPAYMAPEQLAGREVTARSDIYALGLVLYEIFTGRRAFEARSVEELLRLRESTSTPTSPSSIVKEIDPLVERVIERCLEKEPARRPASALQVAAALPGGDPIAAALAAGETPSPEMVAAAPKEGVLRPAVAVALLSLVLGGLALACFLSRSAALYRMTPLRKSPEVLRSRAEEITRNLGYADPPLDSDFGMSIDFPYLDYVVEHDRSAARWEGLRTGEPSVYYFWYRQSPRYLFMPTSYPIDFTEPAWDVSGMAGAVVDSEGRLRRFEAVPPQRETRQGATAAPAPAPDWSKLFAEAGLDQSKFQPIESTWVPPHESDARAAWDGAYPSRPDIRIHVEAAGYRGRPVYFEVTHPWDQPTRQVEQRETTSQRALSMTVLSLIVMGLVGGALLALRNLRLGRGDRRGALRLALFMFAARFLLEWVFTAHHFASPGEEFFTFLEHFKSCIFLGMFVWVLYVAMEPFVRRRWPERIISWSRLLAGGWRDPLVGRDVLIGAVSGVAFILYRYFAYLLPKWQGRAPGAPLTPDNPVVLGLRSFAGGFSNQLMASIFNSFILLLLLLLLFVVTRRTWLAGALTYLVVFGMALLAFDVDSPLGALVVVGIPLTMVGVLYRYGLLALVSMMFLTHVMIFFPITAEISAWYASGFVISTLVCLALVAYAFHTSLAGQPLFKRGLLEE
ncbi:MAG TPA: serine/threonine-protein kinase [Pyrinomonadaceae bacterium]|jgi:serine/threonine-protein kinase|nr:serine/threonine-protein kinase [Pyrinomonadaceae bacterium]